MQCIVYLVATEFVHCHELGVDGVIMHGATPTELAPVVKAFSAP